jgi:hypothetical protein
MVEGPELRDTRRHAAPRGCLIVLCLGLFALVGCAKPWSPDQHTSSGSPVEATDPGTLAFDTWTKGSLHCAINECAMEYTLRVSEPGRVRAEVYAPLGSGGPDFALTVVDESGDEIARPVDDSARPRRVVFDADIGTYRLHVTSRGNDQGLLRYEVVAFLAPGAAPGRRPPPIDVRPAERSAPSGSKSGGSNPAIATTPPGSTNVFVRAEVLDVESEPGGARFVLLDKGLPSGLREQMRGALLDAGEPIGRFVIVEVYEDGCRARIEGQLAREVGIDTLAEIYR